MRSLPLAAAMVMLSLLALAPTASAAGSSVSIKGPSEAIRAEGPATATLDVALTLDGVTCTGMGEIPVLLSVVESKGLRSATLTWERVLFRIAPTTATARPWTGESEVGLRVWGQDPTGYAKVMASYALPSNCVSAKGTSSGQSTTMVHVVGPEPIPEPEPLAPSQVPPIAQRGNELAYTQESREVAQPIVSLPPPVLGAIAGMCLGGLVVFYKRMRAAALA